uniref:Structure-specific endonuclease subunit SLX4 n=1 Tax=Tetraodon nigroviridis TaxID=99883 RepID=H3CE28_TETNG
FFLPPMASRPKRRRSLVPVTPMPHYSGMDTPELKNKLNGFGVRPLPKRQMILKLKEIHQYTHQLLSSDSEDEGGKPSPVSNGNGRHSCPQPAKVKAPGVPAAASPPKPGREEQIQLLSASQGSDTSIAASEDSERSNPELVLSSDSDSDISASQAASRLQDRLQAVRAFILSDPEVYTQILEYRPLVLSQIQARLKAAGIRLGISKLAEYLDSQCITFTTAKPEARGGRREKRSHRLKKIQPSGFKGEDEE